MASIIASRYEQISNDKPSHYEALVGALEDRIQMHFSEWHLLVKPDQLYKQAGERRGSYDSTPWSVERWMDCEEGERDPFVVAVVGFIKGERERALDVEMDKHNTIYDLMRILSGESPWDEFSKAQTHNFGFPEATYITARNDLIITLATVMNEQKNFLTEIDSTDDFLSDYLLPESPQFELLKKAATMVLRTYNKYPIRKLTTPSAPIE